MRKLFKPNKENVMAHIKSEHVREAVLNRIKERIRAKVETEYAALHKSQADDEGT